MEQKLTAAASELPKTSLDFNEISGTTRLECGAGKKGVAFSAARRVLAAAACLMLLIGLGFGTYAYAAEVREYNAAVRFFEENDLSTEGLTRSEIKAVYRDIITESFTYSKTAEVIQKSLFANQVGGYEIWQDVPTLEDVEKLWDDKNYSGWFVPYVPDTYQFHVEYITDDDGVVVETKYYMEKYQEDTAVWRTYLPFWQGDYCEVADGLIAFGHDMSYDQDKKEIDSWIVKLDHDGTIRWIHQLENGFDQEYAEAVLVNADGSYTLFSRGDYQYLCVSRYSPDGERTLYKETYLGSHSVFNAAHYGDGYLLRLTGSDQDVFARFMQVDQEGNVIDGFSYKDEKYYYAIQDMTEWGGKVYVSAYAVPQTAADESQFGGRMEIGRIVDYIFDLAAWEISSEELTPMVRDHYTAVLLVCDPNDDGKVQVFYTIPGSLGADLIITDDGRLIWETESIIRTFFSPATSSFTIGGTCCVYQYAFDETGALVGQAKTDELTNFRR